MLIYFSATGNTKHVVDEIKHENEQIVSIEEAYKNNLYKYDLQDDRIGILSPTYDWGLPSIVYEFLEKLEIHIHIDHILFM
jgi:4Fe-4S ferredoxin, iron-sulfur-binding